MIDRFKAAFNAFRAGGPFNIDGEPQRIILGHEYQFGKDGKASGIKEGFVLNSYAYSIIHRIATTAADIPVEIYEYLADGTKELVEDGDFYELVHNPNEYGNYATMLYEAMVFQLANGNTIEYPVTPIGFQVPTKRYNLYPQYVNIKATETFYGYKAEQYKYQFGNTEYKYAPEEVMHVKRFNPQLNQDNPCYGLSPLTAGYRTLSASNDIQLSEASVIKNRGVAGMLTSRANRPLTEDERRAAQNVLKKRLGGADKFGQIGVTSGNMDFIQFGMSPQDMQLLESGVLKLRDLCNIFGVSSRGFNDTSGSTFNNVKEDEKKYYTQAVLPPLKIYLDKFNDFYGALYLKATGKKYRLEYNTDSIMALQQDGFEAAKKGHKTLEAFRIVIDEIREGKVSFESGVSQLVHSMDLSEMEATEILNGAVQREVNNENTNQDD